MYTRFYRLEDGALESWDLYITPIDWHFRSGDNLHSVFDVNPIFERLFEPFQISPGVVLPPGDYRFTRFASSFASATRRRVSLNLSFRWGSYWSGDAEIVGMTVTYRLPPNFQIGVNTNQTFARLPEGDFTARIHQLNTSFSASPTLSFFTLVQYDNRSRNLGWQSRARWSFQPGSDLFASFQQGWVHEEEVGERRFVTLDRKTSVKLQYALRF
jgi:hypothetical protein